jgi:hypothetical protein
MRMFVRNGFLCIEVSHLLVECMGMFIEYIVPSQFLNNRWYREAPGLAKRGKIWSNREMDSGNCPPLTPVLSSAPPDGEKS